MVTIHIMDTKIFTHLILVVIKMVLRYLIIVKQIITYYSFLLLKSMNIIVANLGAYYKA